MILSRGFISFGAGVSSGKEEEPVFGPSLNLPAQASLEEGKRPA
jgi:hypothetical protein